MLTRTGIAAVRDRLLRVWRAFARPAGSAVPVAAVAGRGDEPGRAAGREAGGDGRSRHCGASGWQLRVGCTDGEGATICPLCSRRVQTQPDAAAYGRVEVIQAHCA
jgi:hypothetical protein